MHTTKGAKPRYQKGERTMSKNITIKEAAEKFGKQLEALGKKASTVGTSKRCLDLFVGTINSCPAPSLSSTNHSN